MADRRDIEAIISCLQMVQDAASRLSIAVFDRDAQIASMQQLIIEMQQRIDCPAADAIDAIVNLARMRNTHWLNILHHHWAENIDDSLASINREYNAILSQRHDESDPHGERNG